MDYWRSIPPNFGLFSPNHPFYKKDKIFEYLYFKVHFLAKNITFRKYWIKFERKSPKREFLIKC